jgi:hypothetical protein
LQSFETERLAAEENFAGLARINHDLIGRLAAGGIGVHLSYP